MKYFEAYHFFYAKNDFRETVRQRERETEAQTKKVNELKFKYKT